MAQSKKNSAKDLITQSTILAAASIIVRLIGLIYRIPLTNIVGNEGMGYYGFAYEVYQILSSYPPVRCPRRCPNSSRLGWQDGNIRTPVPFLNVR